MKTIYMHESQKARRPSWRGRLLVGLILTFTPVALAVEVNTEAGLNTQLAGAATDVNVTGNINLTGPLDNSTRPKTITGAVGGGGKATLTGADGQRILTIGGSGTAAVNLRNLIFTHAGNTPITNGSGAAVYANNAVSLNIANSEFRENYSAGSTSSTGMGAALYVNGVMTGDITDSVFEDNVARNYGGAIYTRGYVGSITNSRFSNNFGNAALGGTGGGAIAVNGNFTGDIAGSTFEDNYTENAGAALWVNGNFTGDIRDSFFIDNTTRTDGGAIYTGDFTGNITNTEFTRNTNTDKAQAGGAMQVYRGIAAAAGNGIYQSTFTENISGMGGAITAFGGWGIEIRESVFTGNQAIDVYGTAPNLLTSHGGALLFYGSMTGNIIDSEFSDNSADGIGGAMNVHTLAADITGSTFKNNTAGMAGGAISIQIDSTGSTIANSLFEGNSSGANGGGALYMQRRASIQLVDTDFIGNSTTGNGGAILSMNQVDGNTVSPLNVISLTTINGAVFAGNTANGVANAIYFLNGGRLEVDTTNTSVLEMVDPVTGHADDTLSIDIVKTGDGVWKLGGDNSFTQAGSGFSTFTVDAGTLHLYGAGEDAPVTAPGAAMSDGSINLAGDDSTFTMAGGTVLSVGGDNAIQAGGAVRFGNGVTIRANTAESASLGLASLTDRVTFDQDLTFDVDADKALALDAILNEATTPGTGLITKTGSGELGLVQADSLADVGRVDVNAGALSSDASQTFRNLNTATGTSLAFGAGTNLTIAEGRLQGTTTGHNLVKTGTGRLEISGRTDLTGALTVTDGVLGVHINMTDPTITADSLSFAPGSTLAITGYTGDGMSGETTVIKTTRQIADGDLPQNWSVDDFSRIPYNFFHGTVARGDDNASIVVTSCLAWYNTDTTICHGNFTLANGETFTLDTRLSDRTDGPSAWDGTTLVKDGEGSLTLMAESDYSGGSTINQGALHIGHGGALGSGAVAVASDATLGLLHNGEFANTVTGAGLMESRGDIYLTGDMTAHTGDVHVYSRTILGDVGGSADSGAAFTVQAGGLLGGNGRVGDITVRSGGVLSPGRSIGAITATGNVVFENGSYYDVEVDPAGTDTDTLTVLGTADLSGGTVRHIGLGTEEDYPTVGRWTILTAAGGLNGSRFLGVESSFIFLDQSLDYLNDNEVQLVIARNSNTFGNFATTPNQRGVASGLDSLTSGSLYDAVTALPAGTDIPRALDMMSGEVHASARSILQSFDRSFGRALMNRAVQPALQDCGFPIWAEFEGFGANGHGGHGVAKARQKGYTATIGAEKRTTAGWLMGAAFRYGDTDVKVRERNSRIDIDSYTFGIYLGKDTPFASGVIRASLGLSYGFHDLDGRRHIDIPTLGQSLRSSYHAHTAQAVADLGYVIDSSRMLKFEPYLRAGWNSVWTKRFTETGGNAALHAGGEHHGNFAHTVGIRARADVTDRLSLRAGAGWQHTYGKRDGSTRFAFQNGGDRFTIHGVSVPKDAAVLNAGIGVKLTSRVDMHLGYDGVLGSRLRSHAGNIALQCTF